MNTGQCIGSPRGVYREHRSSIVLLVKDVPESGNRKRWIHRLYITTNEKLRCFDTSRLFKSCG